jgi:translation initiation factor IF-3
LGVLYTLLSQVSPRRSVGSSPPGRWAEGVAELPIGHGVLLLRRSSRWRSAWRHRLFVWAGPTGHIDRRKEKFITTELRVNDRIRVPRVRVVDADGNQVGIMPTDEALALATEQDLDLVEVAAQADPPVCRVMDYGKYKYEQAVRQREARKKQAHIVVKEMKMRPKIDRHDYETKKGHVIRFLRQGAKVKVTIMFRGREMIHPEIGQQLLERLADDVSDIAKIEAAPKLDGRNMTMVLGPYKEAITAKPGAPTPQRAARTQRESKTKPDEQPEQPQRPIKVTRAEGG